MSIYRIAITAASNKRCPEITTPIIDRHGQQVQGDKPIIGPTEVASGVDVRSYDCLYLKVNPRIELGDLLAYWFRTQMIWSSRAVEAVNSGQLRIDPQIFYVPVKILNSITKRERGDYQLVWSVDTCDVLSPRADVIRTQGSGIAILVSKWLIDESRLPNFDLFKVSPGTWLCTEKFRNVVQDAKLTGFLFHPIPFG